MSMCVTMNDMMYMVEAIDIYTNEQSKWEFNNLPDAGVKVRELKDEPGRFVVKFTSSSTVVI